MKVMDFLALIILVVIMAVVGYLFYLNLPEENLKYGGYAANVTFNISGNVQFYSNMRYPSREISYSIDPSCEDERRADVKSAFNFLESRTILVFTEKGSGGDISVLCSDVAPEPGEKGHFVAGEGGPSKVINSGEYNIISSGKVSLYRADNCPSPQVAIHEILHALGFDHNSDEKSIMYPVTDCSQEIDQHIIKAINALYSIEGFPDLIIEKIDARRTGSYLEFSAAVSNYGIVSSKASSVQVIAGNSLIREFSLDGIDAGAKRILNVENLKVPRDVDNIKFIVKYDGYELSKNNNEAEVYVG